MPWSGLNLSGNPYAEGGARFNPQGRYFGFLPAAGANYDPSMQGFSTLNSMGNNWNYQQSGNYGMPGQAAGGGGGGGGGWNFSGYGNPLADLMNFWGNGGGSGPGMPAQTRTPPWGNLFEYATGIDQRPSITEAQRDQAMAQMRSTPGGAPVNFGGQLSGTQNSEIAGLMQAAAQQAGNRMANQFFDTVNRDQSGLQMGQQAAQAELGQQHQTFANRRTAHRLNQQNALREAQLGILGQLLGGLA